MQIHSHLQSTYLSSGYSVARLASVPEVTELTRETETAGNARFPVVSRSEESEKSNSQDYSEGAKDSTAKKTEGSDDPAAERQQKQQLEEERRVVAQLASRDREVRAHEQAHMAVGGRYAGSASFQYERGPDGVSYAKSGEVPISTSKEADPQATIIKAQIIRRAALAPAEPSPQDRRVAASASALEAEARKELLQANQREQDQKVESSKESDQSTSKEENTTDKSQPFKASVDGYSRFGSDKPDSISSYNPNLPGSTSGRLLQSISNTTLSSNQPGALLDQLV